MAFLESALAFKSLIPFVFRNIDSTKTDYEEGGCNIIWFSFDSTRSSSIEIQFINSADYSFTLGSACSGYPDMEGVDDNGCYKDKKVYPFEKYEEIVTDFIETGGAQHLVYPSHRPPNCMGYFNHEKKHRLVYQQTEASLALVIYMTGGRYDGEWQCVVTSTHKEAREIVDKHQGAYIESLEPGHSFMLQYGTG